MEEAFSFTLNHLDWYCEISQTLDVPVPVLRIFGTSPEGDPVCAHIHDVLPYIYVEYPGQPLDVSCTSAQDVEPVLQSLQDDILSALGIESVVTLIKGVPFYGYHAGWVVACKVQLFNPKMIDRLFDFLTTGTGPNRNLSVYEAHVAFPVQFMMDYNLYGCGLVRCGKVSYRKESECHLWARSGCDSEFDITAQEFDINAEDILNRLEIKERSIHKDLDEAREYPPNFRYLHSLQELWENYGPSTPCEQAISLTQRDKTLPAFADGDNLEDDLIQTASAENNALARKDPRAVDFCLPTAPSFVKTAFNSVGYSEHSEWYKGTQLHQNSGRLYPEQKQQLAAPPDDLWEQAGVSSDDEDREDWKDAGDSDWEDDIKDKTSKNAGPTDTVPNTTAVPNTFTVPQPGPNTKIVWMSALLPPSRAEIVEEMERAAAAGRSAKFKSNPEPPQIMCPTQKERPRAKTATSAPVASSHDMSLMSLEIHVQPENEPADRMRNKCPGAVVCIFWSFQPRKTGVILGLATTGILTVDKRLKHF